VALLVLGLVGMGAMMGVIHDWQEIHCSEEQGLVVALKR
jgi:hypothetical protein